MGEVHEEAMSIGFRIVNVQGDSVRIRSGIFTVDCKVERRGGRMFINKPERTFVHPEMLGAMVAAALAAYEAAERQMGRGPV